MKYILSIFLICFVSQVSAQNIRGIVESDLGVVTAATVALTLPADSSLVKASITNKRGEFIIKGIDSGDYLLFISYLGYEEYWKPIILESQDSNLGSIVLNKRTEKLDEVVVVAEKPMVQVLADKTVFNVQSTINSIGESALGLLRKAPGVTVDNGGGIIVEGKSGVLFYIDGKVSALSGDDLNNYLESLQATDIESIEIITQPSSKYDAAGNAGIINIVLKRDKSLGTNGTLTGGITVGDFARYNSSINFNSRGKQGNLYGNYSNRFGKSTNFINLFRIQSGTEFDARTNSVTDRNTNNIRLGYDYYASAKSTFGLILDGNFNNNFSESDSRTPIRPVEQVENDSVLVANNRNTNQSYNLNGNLNYRYKDTLGYSLNVDLDFGRYSSDRTAFQPNFYLNSDESVVINERITQQITPIDIDIITARADYEQKAMRGILAIGAKFSYVSTDNTFDFFNLEDDEFILDQDQSNNFKYTEKINAAYFNFSRKWQNWDLQLGLRMENTISEGVLTSSQENQNDRVERNYVDFFPSGGITYQLNRKNKFALTYSRRIQRPNYASLNPFEYKIDELSFSRGNPFLQPQYTNNLKLAHTFNYTLTTSLSYSYISDYFARVTVAEGESRNFLTTLNVADQEVINLGISYPRKINDWWNIYVSINAFYSNYKATSPDFLPVSQETLSFYAQNTFSIAGGYRMELSGWYSSPSIWGGTYRTSSLGSLNLAFQKKYLKDRLTARLSFNDILFTSPWEGTTQVGDLFIDGSGGGDSRQVAFSLSYNFGRKEIAKARKRKTGLEDEKKRID